MKTHYYLDVFIPLLDQKELLPKRLLAHLSLLLKKYRILDADQFRFVTSRSIRILESFEYIFKINTILENGSYSFLTSDPPSNTVLQRNSLVQISNIPIVLQKGLIPRDISEIDNTSN